MKGGKNRMSFAIKAVIEILPYKEKEAMQYSI